MTAAALVVEERSMHGAGIQFAAKKSRDVIHVNIIKKTLESE